MNRLIAIVGPTGVGKTRLGIHLAVQVGGEIINADSRQIYRYMDIGTAKPTPEELSAVPHHLIDIVKPDNGFSLAQYQELAFKAIQDIGAWGRVPFLVGGTGLYVRAVIENWQIPKVPPDHALRESLLKRAQDGDAAGLYEELRLIDPEAAGKIDPGNVRRIIRALEVYRSTGISYSRLQIKKTPPFKTLIIGLTQERKKLYRRIDARVDGMIRAGLIKEVENLLKMGYDLSLPAMSAIGYRQIGMYLKGELALGDAVRQIKFETHCYVRHQYAWFRLKDSRINWFDVDTEPEPEIIGLVSDFLADEKD